jgi:hypothetical protein
MEEKWEVGLFDFLFVFISIEELFDGLGNIKASEFFE